MPIKLYNPTTPGRRGASVLDTRHLSKKRPQKSLIRIIKKKAGRNNQGKITIRHQGGGAKRFYRIIDFKRDKFDMPAKVIALEYDPNRNAEIALLEYQDGEKRYVLAPAGLVSGDQVISSKKEVSIKLGNTLPLEHIPIGKPIHNIEIIPGRGGEIARSAGMNVLIQAIEGKYAQLKMPSGEIRLVKKECLATIGSVSRPEWRNLRLGTAGRTRHRGIRPRVTGKAMNPVDHPHGGGEGHNPIGLKHPKTPWGKPALGVKTRRRKSSDKFILQRRKKKK